MVGMAAFGPPTGTARETLKAYCTESGAAARQLFLRFDITSVLQMFSAGG